MYAVVFMPWCSFNQLIVTNFIFISLLFAIRHKFNNNSLFNKVLHVYYSFFLIAYGRNVNVMCLAVLSKCIYKTVLYCNVVQVLLRCVRIPIKFQLISIAIFQVFNLRFANGRAFLRNFFMMKLNIAIIFNRRLLSLFLEIELG